MQEVMHLQTSPARVPLDLTTLPKAAPSPSAAACAIADAG
jgi:hypothetical protein